MGPSDGDEDEYLQVSLTTAPLEWREPSWRLDVRCNGALGEKVYSCSWGRDGRREVTGRRMAWLSVSTVVTIFLHNRQVPA